MADYTELKNELRYCVDGNKECASCKRWGQMACDVYLMEEAADAIEELFKAAEKMHLWIFLHSGDEQAAYDECGLTDEMNVALGYGGKFKISVPEEETDCKKCRYYPPSSLDGKPCTQCDPSNPLMNCFSQKEGEG